MTAMWIGSMARRGPSMARRTGHRDNDADRIGKNTTAAGNSKLDANDIRVLIHGFRSRMDAFDVKLTSVENSKPYADEQHAPSSSGRRDDDDDGGELDRHGAAALTDVRSRKTRPDRVLKDEATAPKTRNSILTTESIWLRLRRLEERADRVGGKTKAAGNSKLATKNQPGVMHRLKSRVYAFGMRMKKAAGNSKRNCDADADNTRVLLNRFKSRLDAIDDKLTVLEKSKLDAEKMNRLINQLKSRMHAFVEKTKAVGIAIVDAGNTSTFISRREYRRRAFGEKTKAAGNAKLDTENTRVLINLESRTNSIGNKLMLWPSMENWKADTETDRTRMYDIKNRVRRLADELDALKAEQHSKTDATIASRVQTLEEVMETLNSCTRLASVFERHATQANELVQEMRAQLTIGMSAVVTTMTGAEDLSLRQEATPTPQLDDAQTAVVILPPSTAAVSYDTEATSLPSSNDDVTEV